MALSMWCFRRLLGGKGSDGPAPAPRKAEVDFPLGVQRGLEQALKRKQELLLKFRPKRQYQPQVTHLSFVYCLYYVNTFFGKYFCFYFIIKFRNLTRHMAASLARGVFSGSVPRGAGLLEGTPGTEVSGPSPVTLPRLARARRALARPGDALSAGGSCRRPAGAESQGHGEGRAVRALSEEEKASTCSPRARPCRLRAFLRRCPPAPAKSRSLLPLSRPEGGWANRAWPDPAPGSSTAGLRTPFRRLWDAEKGIALFLSFFSLSFFLISFPLNSVWQKRQAGCLPVCPIKKAQRSCSLHPRCPPLLEAECVTCLKCSQNLQTVLYLHFWSFKISFRIIFL